jgi:SAM-dependent methyltransferase
VVSLVNPASGAPLRREGEMLVDGAGTSFPIVNGVPRICDADNYSESFGLQWNRFAETQLRREGNQQSGERFWRETGWAPGDLAGVDLLEVGSGAGRFSRVILEQTSARLWSVDYSTAVEANLRNNGRIAPERFNLVQASIYDLPFADASFDKVVCLGVLQHTPDFEASVRALVAKARPGGEIVVDFYPLRGWWTRIHAKYLLRPVTRRMSHDRLLALIERNIDWLSAAHRGLTRSGLGALTRFLPVADLRHVLPHDLPAEQQREWAVLDTFDMFSPEHDHPQRIGDVAAMFRRAGATVTFAGFVELDHSRAAVVRAVRPI